MYFDYWQYFQQQQQIYTFIPIFPLPQAYHQIPVSPNNSQVNGQHHFSNGPINFSSPLAQKQDISTQKTIKTQNKTENLQMDIEEQKKVKKFQYIGRNDFSNMFKSFLFLVFKCNKTKTFIKNLIKRMKLPITLNSFTNKLKRKFPDSKTYIGPKQIRIFVSKLQKNEFIGEKSTGLLFKILLKDFLQKEYKLYVIKKYKGKNQSKKQIFYKCRLLQQQLFAQEGF